MLTFQLDFPTYVRKSILFAFGTDHLLLLLYFNIDNTYWLTLRFLKGYILRTKF